MIYTDKAAAYRKQLELFSEGKPTIVRPHERGWVLQTAISCPVCRTLNTSFATKCKGCGDLFD